MVQWPDSLAMDHNLISLIWPWGISDMWKCLPDLYSINEMQQTKLSLYATYNAYLVVEMNEDTLWYRYRRFTIINSVKISRVKKNTHIVY